MGSTFLKLTNNLLRRINEVELSEGNFSSARGMQAVAKDCVLDSLREIDQQKWLWPFFAVQHSQVLQIAENEYSWPDNFKAVDWDSFQIIKDDALDTTNTHLKPINRSDWYQYLRDIDENFDPDGYQKPRYVFRSHGTGFGVSPAPDKEYTIEFRYYKDDTSLELHDDVTLIPTKFDNVILWGALYHMNLFRENEAGVAIAKQNYDQGIKNMYNLYLGNTSESVTDTRVNFGGNFRSDTHKL
jgi:hypothetical protein